MIDMQTVAFWMSFIGSIVGIVLSIVAIVFSILVDRRSSKVSDHTIQSLQKIESTIERVSSDTRELIKAGWDKMLGNVDRVSPPISSESSAKELAAGIAAELRSELVGLKSNKAQSEKPDMPVEQLEKYVKDLETRVTDILRAQTLERRPSAKFSDVLEKINTLPPTALTLLRAIRNVHLTRKEYSRLSAGRFGPALNELRRAGLIVPVAHKSPRGIEPCYYFPSGIGAIARALFDDMSEPPPELQQEIERELKSIGYPSGHDSIREHESS
jgi:hypothetical protein